MAEDQGLKKAEAVSLGDLEMERHAHDVLVVGAGGAGLRAAIAAAEAGVSVALVCKSLLGKAHTVMAEGGVAAALANADERDNWKVHFRDTLRGGKFLNQWEMARLHAQQAPERVRELERWGAVFDRTDDGRINQRNFGGHRYPRLAHVGDRTGLEIIRTLQDHAVHQNIDIYMECTITELLKAEGRVAGALGYYRADGRLVLFSAKAVVLATGGVGKAYRITSNSWEYTGDGHALAYRAGADLIDMEFVQFHPTGMVWPPSVKGTLVTEGVRGDGGVLLNSEGRRFMFDYIPELFAAETADSEEEANRWLAGEEGARRPPELLTRDVVAKAIRAEVQAGRGSPHGGAYLDIANRRPADYIQRKLPSMYHQFKELAGLDITKESMEVGPTTHYIMGGVRVEAATGAATVPGLFAAGEAAGGMHGANRLGGNSLSDLLVFGALTGAGAATYARGLETHPDLDEAEVAAAAGRLLAPFQEGRSEDPYALHQQLQQVMEEHVGIVRTDEELRQGVAKLEGLEGRLAGLRAPSGRTYNPGWHLCLDLSNMVTASLAIARAALERTESRGAHTRLDYPDPDPELAKTNMVVRRGPEGRMVVVRAALAPLPEEFKAIVEGAVT